MRTEPTARPARTSTATGPAGPGAASIVWRNPYVRVAVTLLVLGLAAAALGRLGAVVRLALLSYLFAYLLNPVVVASQRRGVPRVLAVALVYVALILGLVGASLVARSLGGQLVEIAQRLPTLLESFQTTLGGLPDTLGRLRVGPEVRSVIDGAVAAARTALTGLIQALPGTIQGAGPDLFSRLVGVIGGVAEFALVLVLGGYMLVGFSQVGETLLELLPRSARPLALALAADVSTAVGGYIRGQIVIAASIGVMVGLGLTLVGEPLALGLGFIAGLFNIVPYLGVVIAVTPALLLAIPGGLTQLALVALVFTVANQLEAHVFSPIILSRSTDLHPVTVILALLSGLTLGGIAGGIVAVPLAALGKVLIRKYWLGSPPHGDTP